MKACIFILLFVYNANAALAQKSRLLDKSFRSSFITDSFSFNKIHSKLSNDWCFVAGRCIIMRREHSGKEYDDKKKYMDSLMVINDKIVGKGDSVLNEKVAVFADDCLEKYRSDKNKKTICDSLVEDFKSKNYPYRSLDSLVDYIQYYNDSFENKKKYWIAHAEHSNIDTATINRKINLCNLNGFGTWCPPGDCNWFLLSFNNNNIKPINNINKLIDFLGDIDDPWKACLILKATSFGDSRGYPSEGTKIKYRKIADKIYFIENLRLSDCPIRNFDCLISVDKKGKVTIVDKIETESSGGCI